MSFTATKWAWQQQIAANTKLVLLALADYADDAGVCFPSQRKLASKCGLSRSTINVHLQRLVELNLISIEHQSNRLGQRTASRYHLALKQGLNSRQPLSEIQTLGGPKSRQHITSQLTNQKNLGSPGSGQGNIKPALKDAL